MVAKERVERTGIIFDAGIDYITCFSASKDGRRRFLELADGWVTESRNAGEAESPASRFGFEGYRGNHWFFGVRTDGLLATASGSLAPIAARELIAASTNVSRLDFQVTYVLDYEDPYLAVNEFNRLESMPNKRGRPHGYSLVFSRPKGQTLYVNKRTSDAFGRLYDKGAECGLYPVGNVWRWELELKRRTALHHAMVCREHGNLATYSTSVVKAFYSGKG